MAHGKHPERGLRDGIGSVFLPGVVAGAAAPGRPEPLAVETSEAHCARLLADLNQPAARWKTSKIEAVTRALLGEEATLVTKRVTALSQSYQKHLRAHIDSWINTGKGPSGDRPATRRPSRTIDDLVTRVFATSRAVPVPVKDGYVVVPVPPGDLVLDGDGGLQAAERMLVGMLVSPWRLKIAQCVKCRRYFRLKHWERTYREGTICTRCMPRRKVERSSDAKKNRRGAAEKQLYQVAAKRFWRKIAGHPHWRLDQGLKAAIAVALTDSIGGDAELRALYPDGRVTGKWLAHKKNWEGIETAAQAMSENTQGSHPQNPQNLF